MKKCLKAFTVLAVLAISFVLFSAAIPAGNTSEAPAKMQQAVQAYNNAAADGKVSYKELKIIAEDLKGSKLTVSLQSAP
jgi:lysozyme family protein